MFVCNELMTRYCWDKDHYSNMVVHFVGIRNGKGIRNETNFKDEGNDFNDHLPTTTNASTISKDFFRILFSWNIYLSIYRYIWLSCLFISVYIILYLSIYLSIYVWARVREKEKARELSVCILCMCERCVWGVFICMNVDMCVCMRLGWNVHWLKSSDVDVISEVVWSNGIQAQYWKNCVDCKGDYVDK